MNDYRFEYTSKAGIVSGSEGLYSAGSPTSDMEKRTVPGWKKRMIREERKRRERRRLFCAVLTTALLTVMITMLAMSLTAHAAQADGRLLKQELAYTSVQIAAGDTLWSIAEREMGEGWKNRNQFIRAVKRVNGLTDSDIHEGSYLTIPHYESVIGE